MSCISKVLELKGDKEFLKISNCTVVEDGGIYKNHEYLITFRDMGFRCGYVAIDKNHKFYNLNHYDNLPYLDVHGGVTFFNKSEAILGDLIENTCGDKWIGFDAGHYLDLCDPDLVRKFFNKHLSERWYAVGEPRTKQYMIYQCKNLIDQLIEVK